MNTTGAASDYIPTSDKPCPECGGDTIPATPGRPEEQGWYCEACGVAHDATGRRLPG